MRKLIALLMMLSLLLGSAAFAAEAPAAEEVSFTGPYLLTSAGQSADFQMVKTMLKMNKTENYTDDALVTADTLPADLGALIIVIGGSSKGLGAAGIDADQELARLNEVMKAAEEKNIPILAMHIGGMARRGELSDKFIEPVVAHSKALIVVEEANQDGLFDELAKKYEVELKYIAKKTEGSAVLADWLN